MAKSVKYTVNFLEAKEGDLHRYQPLWPSFWATAPPTHKHSAALGQVGGPGSRTLHCQPLCFPSSLCSASPAITALYLPG